MTIPAFDPQNLRTIRDDINAALAAVCVKHGISLSIGRISYTAKEFTTRLTASTAASPESEAVASATGLASNHNWVRQWNSSIASFGIPTDALGKEVLVRGQRFLLAGLTRSPRAPVAAKPLDRKTSKYTLLSIADVKQALAA